MSLFNKAGAPGRKSGDEALLEILLSGNRQRAEAAEERLFSKYHRLVGKGDKRLSKGERMQAYESAFLNFIKSLPHQGGDMLEAGGLRAAIERFFEAAQTEMLWVRAIRAGEEPECTEATQALMLHLAPLKDSRQLKQKWGTEVVDEAFVESFEELLKKIKTEGFAARRSLAAFFNRIFKFRLLDAYDKEKKNSHLSQAEPGGEVADPPAAYEQLSVFNRFEEPAENKGLLIAERLRAFLDDRNFHLLEQLSREARMAVKQYWSDILSDLVSLIEALKEMKKESNTCLELLLMKVEKKHFREIYVFLEQRGLLKEASTDERRMKNLVNSRVRRCREKLYEQLGPTLNLIYRKKDKR